MKVFFNRSSIHYWLDFLGRTLFYFGIIVALIYLYHYKNIDGGTFIYNEF